MHERDNAPAAIGLRLRALMTVMGLTAEAMIEITRARKVNVTAWLEGRRAPPPRAMVHLASRAGIPVAWIFHGGADGLPPEMAERLRAAMDEQATAD